MHLAPRYVECTGGKQWYVCSAGDYQGCCSSDPCTTGICPDDELASSSSTSTSSALPTSSTSEIASSTSATSSSTTSEIVQTTSSTTSSTAALTTADQTNSVLAASATNAQTITPASTGSKSSGNAALIGGVVGGIMGFLLLVALLWFCWRRRRREQAFNIVGMHRSTSSQSLHEQKTTSPGKPSPNPGSSTYFTRTTDSLAPSTTSSNANTTISGSDTWRLSIPGLTNGPSEPSSRSSGMAMSKRLSTTSDLPPIPQSSELPVPLPQGIGFTPELPDTTVIRPRAELASHPRSELINVPRSQRQRPSLQDTLSGPFQYNQPGPRPRDSSPSTSASTNTSLYPSPSASTTAATSTTSPAVMSRSTARRIVTDEGIVLGANLDRYSGPVGPDSGQRIDGDECGRRCERNAQDHVMSFMEFGENGVGGRSGRLYGNGDMAGSHDGEGRPLGTMSGNYARPVRTERAARDAVILGEGSRSPMSDVPPVYESAGFSPRDKKSPSATMGLGLRGMERE